MNRANAVRYGPAHDSTAEKTSLLKGIPNFGLSPRNSYSAVRDLPLRPFVSHQILLSCVPDCQLEKAWFLSREISESVINLILAYLDTQSLASIRVLMLAESLLHTDISRGPSDICTSISIGSSARSAMSVLSNRLFPANRESTAVQIKDSAEICLLNLIPYTNDIENQAAVEPSVPDALSDDVDMRNRSSHFILDVVSACRKCDASFYPVSGLVAISIFVIIFVVYQ